MQRKGAPGKDRIMNKEEYFDTVEQLTLALMYLTRFKDEYGVDNFAWKCYSFEVLNDLIDKDLIRDGKRPSRTKSVYITPEGVEKAKEALARFGIEE